MIDISNRKMICLKGKNNDNSKPFEKWGRKATGLRFGRMMIAGLPKVY